VSTWILQANPKLYDIDEALKHKELIYWRVPQYTNDVQQGDRVLLWRSGKQASFVGWGVVLTAPKKYNLSGMVDPYLKGGHKDDVGEFYSPIRVWPGNVVQKSDVATVIPKHRIITAPMGTVFPLDGSDLELVEPYLEAAGYDLGQEPNIDFNPAPVVAEPEVESKPAAIVIASAKLTPAMFLLSSTPEHPTDITIEGDALKLTLVERDAVKALDESWDAVGVYLLVGFPAGTDSALSVYVGKAQGLRSRVKSGHQDKADWTRCLLVQRPGLHPFNASDISWLERRLIDVLLEAPEVDLVNKTPPPTELVPDYKAEILERTAVAILGVLGVLGAYTV
jgi:hypothetical protein